MTPRAEPPLPSRVGIVGLGLMGGSLARGLKDLPHPPVVRGLAADPNDVARAMSADVIDEAPESSDAFFHQLDLVVYCTPLEATLRLLEEHAPLVSENTVVTDVVSLKAPILARAEALGMASVTVGSHPMAGGEGQGFAASRSGLFRDAPVWVVAGRASTDAVQRVEAFWRMLGARIIHTGAEAHDDLMAWVSHLPQLTSNALALALEEAGLKPSDLGPGGADMTRLAGSSPSMWIDLLRHAPSTLAPALEAVMGKLTGLRDAISEHRADDVAASMDQTRRWSRGKPWK